MPALSDIERILIVSDGTFTYQLETFVREPIGVVILSNQLAPLSASDARLLDCSEGTLVWDRRTLLRAAPKQASPIAMPPR
jgi:chorismate-pyruvate lyase